jgi:hypothetical protein
LEGSLRLGDEYNSTVGSGLLALSIFSATAMKRVISGIFFGTVALYYCGVSFYSPTVLTMLLQWVPWYRRGAVMGQFPTNCSNLAPIGLVAAEISRLILAFLIGSSLQDACICRY